MNTDPKLETVCTAIDPERGAVTYDTCPAGTPPSLAERILEATLPLLPIGEFDVVEVLRDVPAGEFNDHIAAGERATVIAVLPPPAGSALDVRYDVEIVDEDGESRFAFGLDAEDLRLVEVKAGLSTSAGGALTTKTDGAETLDPEAFKRLLEEQFTATLEAPKKGPRRALTAYERRHREMAVTRQRLTKQFERKAKRKDSRARKHQAAAAKKERKRLERELGPSYQDYAARRKALEDATER